MSTVAFTHRLQALMKMNGAERLSRLCDELPAMVPQSLTPDQLALLDHLLAAKQHARVHVALRVRTGGQQQARRQPLARPLPLQAAAPSTTTAANPTTSAASSSASARSPGSQSRCRRA